MGRKKDVVLCLLRGAPVDAVAREVAVPIYQLERWRDRALAGINAGLKERENDPVERQLDDANRRIGERVRDPTQGAAGTAPFSRPEVVAMSRETAAGAGKPYGLERVCRVLACPRSTVYAQAKRQAAQVVPLQPARRGPQPNVSDVDLLNAIRADLAATPFAGEGHRKVWARLRMPCDIRVSRARVLRLMRENPLLSPHRRPQGRPVRHAGTITADRPNAMWGTNGMRIETVDEGGVWVFSAVDHGDACCIGIPAVKIGNRFAALPPISQGLHSEFGATDADAGRGLTLRMDNGTQYTADACLNQIKFWGIAPSFACVAAPQTNGVAERFNRTLKEQASHGRIFRDVEAVRVAVTAFKERYNRPWRLEQRGFMSPLEARQAYAVQKAA